MSTILSFLSGRQITNNSGVPQSGAKVYHYRENTTTALTVWANDAASIAHPQPVPCDAGGFVPLIYVDDTFDWKVVITTATDVILQTYDNLPKAESGESTTGFAPPLLAWTQVTSASSPLALTVNDAGKAYEADTTGGSIEFDLPSAASVGNGKGFWFKKTAAANTMTIDPSGSETIDDASTSLAIVVKDTVIGIFSNGAEWYRVTDIPIPTPTVQRLTSGSGTYTPAAGVRSIRVRMLGGGAGGAAQATNNGTNGGASSFGTWTANGGTGGQTGGTPGAGGTGGTNGTGTLLHRMDGATGTHAGTAASSSYEGGFGMPGVFGGSSKLQNAVANAAPANSGAGGSGAWPNNGAVGGPGGNGEYVEFTMTAAQIGASLSYAVGAGGAGGAAGTLAGSAGGSGLIVVEEFY